MLKENTASDIINSALDLGANFCDIFIEKNNQQSLRVLDSKVHSVNSGIEFGIGIRLLYGTNTIYGYTSSTKPEDLLTLTKNLAALKQTSSNSTNNIQLSPFELKTYIDQHPVTAGLNNDRNSDEKLDLLFKIDQYTRQHSDKISQVDLGTSQRLQEIEIFNSEGLHIKDQRHYCRVPTMCIAKDGNEQSTGSSSPGALQGWEFSNSINPQQLGEKIAKQALVKLTAAPCPAGKLPVIIGNGFGGVIFHEACGHSLETTAVQKKASVFWNRKGEQIAHPCVNAVDDGTMENHWGSINIDDEGMPTQKTQLIKDGILVNFMADMVGSLKTDHPRTGSARKQSYKFAPASRMRNTFIEPGDHTLDEILATIDNGIYCKEMGGGSINPGTGEFNFSATEPYLIENGKIKHALKSATLIGTGENVLKNISMIGNDFELAPGMCGSVSGAVPTTVGQASLKVDEILVGGDA